MASGVSHIAQNIAHNSAAPRTAHDLLTTTQEGLKGFQLREEKRMAAAKEFERRQAAEAAQAEQDRIDFTTQLSGEVQKQTQAVSAQAEALKQLSELLSGHSSHATTPAITAPPSYPGSPVISAASLPINNTASHFHAPASFQTPQAPIQPVQTHEPHAAFDAASDLEAGLGFGLNTGHLRWLEVRPFRDNAPHKPIAPAIGGTLGGDRQNTLKELNSFLARLEAAPDRATVEQILGTPAAGAGGVAPAGSLYAYKLLQERSFTQLGTRPDKTVGIRLNPLPSGRLAHLKTEKAPDWVALQQYYDDIIKYGEELKQHVGRTSEKKVAHIRNELHRLETEYQDNIQNIQKAAWKRKIDPSEFPALIEEQQKNFTAVLDELVDSLPSDDPTIKGLSAVKAAITEARHKVLDQSFLEVEQRIGLTPTPANLDLKKGITAALLVGGPLAYIFRGLGPVTGSITALAGLSASTPLFQKALESFKQGKVSESFGHGIEILNAGVDQLTTKTSDYGIGSATEWGVKKPMSKAEERLRENWNLTIGERNNLEQSLDHFLNDPVNTYGVQPAQITSHITTAEAQALQNTLNGNVNPDIRKQLDALQRKLKNHIDSHRHLSAQSKAKLHTNDSATIQAHLNTLLGPGPANWNPETRALFYYREYLLPIQQAAQNLSNSL